jgi:hypothetical protein
LFRQVIRGKRSSIEGQYFHLTLVWFGDEQM